MAVVFTFDFHRYRLFNRDSPHDLVKVIGLGSSDIGKGKSAINVNLVIVFEKTGQSNTIDSCQCGKGQYSRHRNVCLPKYIE